MALSTEYVAALARLDTVVASLESRHSAVGAPAPAAAAAEPEKPVKLNVKLNVKLDVKLDAAGRKRKRDEEDKAAGLTRRQCGSCDGEGWMPYDNIDDDDEVRGEPCDDCRGNGEFRQRACKCGRHFDVEKFPERRYYGYDQKEEQEGDKKKDAAAAAKMMARELCGDCQRAKKADAKKAAAAEAEAKKKANKPKAAAAGKRAAKKQKT